LKAIWHVSPGEPLAAQQLAEALRLPPLLAALLAVRGFKDPDQASAFLDPGLHRCHDPGLLNDMAKAVDRLAVALRDQETVVIWGDYDVDGITSTAVLLKTFSHLGLKAIYHLPDRLKDGYGLNSAGLKGLREKGYKIVVTVDCGASAVAEAEAARLLGMDLIITDHHVPSHPAPQAFAVINPKASPNYPYDMLAGVGVAYKLGLALAARCGQPLPPALDDQLLELVAVGTVADMAPLDGENRSLVREGLKRLRSTRNAGFLALAEAAFVNLAKADTQTVGYVLGPRLNAGGRIGDPRLGVELLMSPYESKCKELAKALDGENKQRRSMERKALDEARPMAEALMSRGAKALVVWSSEWHPGVVGLLASRLMHLYHRPVAAFAIFEGIAKGSLRAKGRFHIVEALDACSSLLVKYGGHQYAGGATLSIENLEAFQALFESQAARCLSDDDLLPSLHADLELPLESMDAQAMAALTQMSPFGEGNPKPLFISRACHLMPGAKPVGDKGEHLKLSLSQGAKIMPAIAFGQAGELAGLDPKRLLDVAYQPEWNDFLGKRELQLQVRGLSQEAP
jgi:single-stranded-DNA-specific exonuclease